jgi:glyoxylase-like metal-dependent hydrolase (beta-lactamase superfamily II)
MRVHHLNAATLCPASARLVTGRGPWLGRARLVCHVLVLETPRGVVLVDTGLGTGDVAAPARLGSAWVRQVAPRLDPAEPVVAQLARLGLAAADVTDVVLTHLDLDHAGGIADFPAARIHVHAREHEAAMATRGTRAGLRYIAAHWQHGPRWALFGDGGERWFGFEGVRALTTGDPDVLLVPLHGHTVGHTGVAVRTADRWLLHAGDSYFFHGQVATPPTAPFVLRMFQRRSDMNRAERIANQERVRELIANHGDQVTAFCAHDAVELDHLQAAAGSRSRAAAALAEAR